MAMRLAGWRRRDITPFGGILRRRSHRRYTRRLETDFFFGDTVHKGISSNLSERGVFIRTRTCLTVGSPIEFVLYLPDGGQARLRGTVRRAIRTDSELIKNGMGIEIISYDDAFARFLQESIGVELRGSARSEGRGEKGGTEKERPRGVIETRIIACPSCRAKNRVAVEKLSLGPRCGRCGEKLK